MASSHQYARQPVDPHTEVLPYVAIRIPCLPKTHARHPRAEEGRTQQHPSGQWRYPTAPRCLPAPIALLLAVFFLVLTGAAIGSDGFNSLSQRSLGVDLLSPEAMALFNGGRPVEHSARQLELERERDEKRRRVLARDGPGLFDRLALVHVPPLSAEPFGPLAAYEYASLAVFLVRQLIARPIWHLLLWWHVACAAACLAVLAQSKADAMRSTQTQSARGATSSSPLPGLPLLLLHALFWCGQALVFGWPAVYLLKRQLQLQQEASTSSRPTAAAARAKAS